MTNIELLQETLTLVEEADRHDMWNQAVWVGKSYWDDGTGVFHLIDESKAHFTYKDQEFCGTACCFAGWTVMLDGWKPKFTRGEDLVTLSKDGNVIEDWEVEDLARNLLGLDKYEAAHLFNANNSLDDLRALVADYIEAAQ